MDSDQVRDQLLKLKTTTIFGDYAVDERGYQIANKGLLVQWQDGWYQMLEDGRSVSDDALRDRARSIDPGDNAFVFYTSGTTGFPKGAVHDHLIIKNTADMADRMGVTADDVILMYLPLFHAFGFICGALMSMIGGARQVLTETFDANACVDLIASEKATMIHGFDTHFKDLLDAQDKNPRDVSSVRTGICGTGMSSAIPIARQARRTFGNFMTGFGMSEALERAYPGVPPIHFVGGDLDARAADERLACHAIRPAAGGEGVRLLDAASASAARRMPSSIRPNTRPWKGRTAYQ